jgi:hypothetical protein
MQEPQSINAHRHVLAAIKVQAKLFHGEFITFFHRDNLVEVMSCPELRKVWDILQQ